MQTHRSGRREGRGTGRSPWIRYTILGAVVLLVAWSTWSALEYSSPTGRASGADASGAVKVGFSPSAPPPARMTPAPNFSLRLFNGTELALSDLRGKPVVLNFWASWCPPCRAEARDLERGWQAFKGRGVVFLGVNVQDSEQGALGFIKEFGITYQNGPDSSNKIASSYGVTGLPETFFINRDGKVTRHVIGPVAEGQLAAYTQELLQ